MKQHTNIFHTIKPLDKKCFQDKLSKLGRTCELVVHWGEYTLSIILNKNGDGYVLMIMTQFLRKYWESHEFNDMVGFYRLMAKLQFIEGGYGHRRESMNDVFMALKPQRRFESFVWNYTDEADLQRQIDKINVDVDGRQRCEKQEGEYSQSIPRTAVSL